MRREGAANWQVPLADLSLILFIVTGGALSKIANAEEPAVPAEGVAAAVYVDGPDAPPLIQLINSHTPAVGEQLTVLGYYAPGERSAVARRTEELATEAIAAGIEPRVIVQPAAETAVVARFAHDAPPGLARTLRNP